MFPLEIWAAYTAACLLLVLSPGPDPSHTPDTPLSRPARQSLHRCMNIFTVLGAT